MTPVQGRFYTKLLLQGRIRVRKKTHNPTRIDSGTWIHGYLCKQPAGATDLQCWSRFRKDSVFFLLTRIRKSKICENPNPNMELFLLFGNSRSLHGLYAYHFLSKNIDGFRLHHRRLNRSRILKFEKFWTRTRIGIQKFCNRSDVGVWKCGSGNLCKQPEVTGVTFSDSNSALDHKILSRIWKIFKFENLTLVQTPTTIDTTEIQQYFYF